MKVTIHRDLCEANEICCNLCPEAFAIDDNGDLQMLIEQPGEELRKKVELAVKGCPRNALSLEETA